MASPQFIATSPAMQEVLRRAAQAADSNAPVFLSGETGTGKEALAQFIHHLSDRSGGPFVAINLAALSEEFLEREIFGQATGAAEDTIGLLEIASGGTLLLDEIAEAPLGFQAKLLRVLDEGVVRRVGSDASIAPVGVDVRFIATASREPRVALAQGSFRPDLFDRLNGISILLPPLRERLDDIVPLAQHFLSLAWRRQRDNSVLELAPTFSQEAIRALETYEWPGNVRELRSHIERSVIQLEPGSMIEVADLFPMHSPDLAKDAPVLSICVDPGSAPAEDVAELLADLSLLYRKMGGAGIIFSPEGTHFMVHEVVP